MGNTLGGNREIIEFISENPDKNMFELEWDEAYAGTRNDVWKAIRFFNELKVVSLKELEPEDRTCLICREPYEDPEDGNIIHIPVRLPCSHIFGKGCLAKWTTPFVVWENMPNTCEEEESWFRTPYQEYVRAADCPMCRGEICVKPRFVESAMGLEARLMFWDRAYEKVGCLRSEKEEESRADLIKYVEFNRIANGQTIEKEKTAIEKRWMKLHKYHLPALDRLFVFSMRRKTEGTTEGALTPTQARIQQNLEQISEEGLDITLDDPTFVGYTEANHMLFVPNTQNDEEDHGYDIVEDSDTDEETWHDDDNEYPRQDIRLRHWYISRLVQEFSNETLSQVNVRDASPPWM